MNILSHSDFKSIVEAKQEILTRIKHNKIVLEVFENLLRSKLGVFLIVNRGLNGYWTDKIVNFPSYSEIEKEKYTDFDKYLMTMPIFMATQQRFLHFKKAIQDISRSKMINVLAAPCGVLPEFYNAENKNINYIDALDIDKENFSLIEEKYRESKDKSKIRFINLDLLKFDKKNTYDLVVSNGLNLYISNIDILNKMFSILFNSLKANGYLITSFLSLPAVLSDKSPWDMEKINLDLLAHQELIFKEILNVSWANYQSFNEFKALLREIGFQEIRIIWDVQKMFPTIIAQK